MFTNEEFLSIKDELKKIGMDPDNIIFLQYKKVGFHLEKLIVRTEKSLIDLQEKDGLDVISDRQNSVQNTLNQLIFAHNKVHEMQSLIYTLKAENEMLTNRLKARNL